MHLVLDIGNSRVKGAFFQESAIVDVFAISLHPFSPEDLMTRLQNKKVTRALIASVNNNAEPAIEDVLKRSSIPFWKPSVLDTNMILEVEEKEAVGIDRIANCYGALSQFPQNDCVVIDVGTAATCDLVSKKGQYLGGMIYPGPEMSLSALAKETALLPSVPFAKPSSVLGGTTKTHIQNGIYFGLLGALERIVAELRNALPSPSSAMVIATGGAFAHCPELEQEGQDFIDRFVPYLTLVGLHEILQEKIRKEEK